MATNRLADVDWSQFEPVETPDLAPPPAADLAPDVDWSQFAPAEAPAVGPQTKIEAEVEPWTSDIQYELNHLARSPKKYHPEYESPDVHDGDLTDIIGSATSQALNTGSRAYRGALGALGGLAEMATPQFVKDVKPDINDPIYEAIDRQREFEADLPAPNSNVGAFLGSAAAGFGPSGVASMMTGGQDVIAEGGSLKDAMKQHAIDAALAEAGAGTGMLGRTFATRAALQGGTQVGLGAAARKLEGHDALDPAAMGRDLATGAFGALFPNGRERAPETVAPRGGTDITGDGVYYEAKPPDTRSLSEPVPPNAREQAAFHDGRRVTDELVVSPSPEAAGVTAESEKVFPNTGIPVSEQKQPLGEPIQGGSKILFRGDPDALNAQLDAAGQPRGLVMVQDGEPVGIYVPKNRATDVANLLESENATEARQQPENDQQQYPDRNPGRTEAEAGGGNRVPEGGQEPQAEVAPTVTAARVQAEPSAETPPRYLAPDEHHRELFESKLAEVQQKHGLSDEQTADIRDSLFSDLKRDSLTGHYRAEELRPALDRAQEYVRQTGQDAQYVEVDVRNLNQLNARFGNSGADKHYRAFTDITLRNLEAAGGLVVPVRKGGDELGYVITGADHAAVSDAMEKSRAEALDYAKSIGMENEPHHKGYAPGTGIHYGQAVIAADAPLADTVSHADKLVEARKKGEETYEHARTPEAARPGPSGGQARGAEESPARVAGEDAARGPAVPVSEPRAAASDEVTPSVPRGDGETMPAVPTRDAAAREAEALAATAPPRDPVESATSAQPIREAANDADRPATSEAQPVAEGENVTGIKHAKVAEERALKQKDELHYEGKRTFGDAWDSAGEKLKKDSAYASTLAKAIVEKPRALNAEESAALIQDRMRIQNWHRKFVDEAASAMESGDIEREAHARAAMMDLEGQLEISDQASKASGYEQGFGLAARRMMAKEDYTMAAVATRAKVAAERPITHEERAKLEALTKRVEELDAQLAEQQKQRAESRARPVSPKAKKSADDEFKALAGRLKAIRAEEHLIPGCEV